MKKFIYLSFTILALSACGEKSSVMAAKFTSIQQCVSSMKKHHGDLTIYTNKPDEVSGKLPNGKTFACEIKTTGTDGTYVSGWFYE